MGVRALSAAVGLAALILPGPAEAQSWFTREACTIEAPSVDPSVIDAALQAEIAAEAATLGNGVGRFWRITSPEGAVSHLWGTLHSTNLVALDLPRPLRRALAEARTVALEVDGVAPSREAYEAILRGDGVYGYGRDPMFYVLDRRVLDWIDARMRGLGILDSAIDIFTPAGLAQTVLSHPCDDFTGDVYPSQDGRIQLLGSEAGARIVGLEPWDAMIAALSRDDRVETSLAIIELYGLSLGPENVKASLSTAFALYREGRIAEMIAWERRDATRFFGEERGAEIIRLVDGYLVVERNFAFLARALPLLREGGAVIAVGAFHLPGPTGLVSLFRGAGFTVERVRTEGEVE